MFERYLMKFMIAAALALYAGRSSAQEITGTLIGTVRDDQGGVLRGATVRVSSTALIGGPQTISTNEIGSARPSREQSF